MIITTIYTSKMQSGIMVHITDNLVWPNIKKCIMLGVKFPQSHLISTGMQIVKFVVMIIFKVTTNRQH